MERVVAVAVRELEKAATRDLGVSIPTGTPAGRARDQECAMPAGGGESDNDVLGVAGGACATYNAPIKSKIFWCDVKTSCLVHRKAASSHG
jgi:hypothetical protein